MPFKGNPYRNIITVTAAALFILFTVIFLSRGDVNLSGTAINLQQLNESETSDSPSEPPTSVADNGNGSDGNGSAPGESNDTNPEDENPPPTDIPVIVPQPTAAPTEVVQPTEIPAPTEVEVIQPTATIPVPTEQPTLEPTIAPEETTEAPSETTVEATEESDVPTEDATLEPTSEVPLEETAEVTSEATAEVTPEVTAEALPLSLQVACTASGVEFIVTNLSADVDMIGAESYSMDGVPSGEFQLAAGENIMIMSGYGMPAFSAGDMQGQPAEPCNQPPALSVSNVICTADMGVVISITNDGGAMIEPQTYSVDDNPVGEIQLGAGESIDIQAGYGSPVFSSGDLTATPDTLCVKPGQIGGVVWSDANGDGFHDADETGLGGATVILSHPDGSKDEIVTAPDGIYVFANLEAGDYTVRITPPVENLIETYDLDGNADSSVLINMQGEIVNADFGYQQPHNRSISGLIWLETENFGVRDAGEAGIAGVEIRLRDESGTVIQTYTAQADGLFHFAELSAGTYTLQIDQSTLPDRLFITFNPDGSQNFATTVTLTPDNDIEDLEFGMVGAF